MSIDTGIAKTDREDIAETLMHVLADTYSLYLKTQGCHWNIVGSEFPQLHEMFELQYRELADAVDVIAERIRALASTAPASFAEFARLSSIPDEDDTPEAREMLRRLLDGHEMLTRVTRMAVPRAAQADDYVTVDVLTERMRAHEQAAWMLRSTIHA